MAEYLYVVTRDGRRVSSKNHDNRKDALTEAKYWTNLIHKYINGRQVDPRSVIRVRKIEPDQVKKIK